MKTTLSIVIPFYNSSNRCTRLLNTLRGISFSWVEIVLVDDGSTDDTIKYLEAFQTDLTIPNKIIKQTNRGPGGARNSGLIGSTGNYVWFVDSDDDINLNVLTSIKELIEFDYDLIDFRYKGRKVHKSIDLAEGEYTVDKSVRLQLVENCGSFWTKVFQKDYLINSKLFQPEYCLTEDAYLLYYLYPFYTKKFFVSHEISYYYNIDFESMTRTEDISLNYYDRLFVPVEGLKVALKYATKQESRILIKKTIKFCFRSAIREHLLSGRRAMDIYKTIRIMQRYRSLEKRCRNFRSLFFEINKNMRFLSNIKNIIRNILAVVLYNISYIFPKQKNYFEEMHNKAWKHEIIYPAVELLSEKDYQKREL